MAVELNDRGAAVAIPAITSPFDVRIQSPGSKSLTNRALVLAAIAEGTSTLEGALVADDTQAIAAALSVLGAGAMAIGNRFSITGCSGRFPGGGGIDCGLGGTPARFLLAAATLADQPVVIDGGPRLRERPMADLVTLLTSIGAAIEPLETEGHLPLLVRPAPLRSGPITVGATASSQYISAVLLIGAAIPGGIVVTATEAWTSVKYIELTIAELVAWGVDVQVQREDDGQIHTITVSEGSIAGRRRMIEADASSSIFLAAAAALHPGSKVVLPGVSLSSLQPDIEAIRALSAYGAELEEGDDGLVVRGTEARRGWPALDASGFPDGAVMLAVLGACGDHPTTITGLGTLRVKESDRIAALETELAKVGSLCTTTKDSITITPMKEGDQKNARIATWDDHRLAMAFAVLGTRLGGLEIEDPHCVAKSYPEFFGDLSRLYGKG